MKKILVNKDIRLLTALKKLNKSGEKTLIIVNSENKLLGTISDGDIRNKLLKNNNLNNKIDTIFNKKPTFLIENKFNKEDIEKIFLNKQFDIIPIVNNKHIVVDYISWSNFFKNKKKKYQFKKIETLIVMAGGEGTRLKPFTNLLPKPLIPIKGKPIIDLILEKFNELNIKNFIFSIKSKAKILKAYLAEKNYKQVKFLEEQKPLGTVGSLFLLKNKIKKDFLLTNCDILADINLENFYNFHNRNKNYITLVVSAKKLSLPYGVCELNDNGVLNGIKEKPAYNFFVNIGLYLINPKALQFIPNNRFFHMTDLIKVLKKKKLNVGAYPIQDDEWLDVGQWNEYKKAVNNFE